jgi:hypothetical protein
MGDFILRAEFINVARKKQCRAAAGIESVESAKADSGILDKWIQKHFLRAWICGGLP